VLESKDAVVKRVVPRNGGDLYPPDNEPDPA